MMTNKINIGKNSNLVQEVFSFLDENKLLNPACFKLQNDKVICDLNLAKKKAWTDVYGEQEFTWSDIRSLHMSNVWDRVYENDENSLIDDLLVQFLDELNDKVFQQLNEMQKDLLDDIVSDLKGCIYSRAFQAINNNFFEEIFSIYKNGGWPCGWFGDFPEGQLIAYFPATIDE